MHRLGTYFKKKAVYKKRFKSGLMKDFLGQMDLLAMNNKICFVSGTDL